MDNRLLATTVRRLGEARTRRGTLAGALLALTVPAHSLSGLEVQAKKRKKTCKQPKPDPEPSCQEACPGNCRGCLTRNADSLLCSGGFASSVQRCRSDNDCVGTTLPYCLAQFEKRDTGEITNLRRDTDGVCGSAPACDA